MKIFDRIIFSIIAVALTLIALHPLFSEAGRGTDVNIAAVGGYAIHGREVPTK